MNIVSSQVAASEVDHTRSFDHGGPTIFDNLENIGKRHHQLKHFTDDHTRAGSHHIDQSPERAAIRLLGWTPSMTEPGVEWTSPSGSN